MKGNQLQETRNIDGFLVKMQKNPTKQQQQQTEWCQLLALTLVRARDKQMF